LKNNIIENKYSDSLIPFGIGTSFFLILVMLLLAGSTVGYFLKDYETFPQSGGIILLIIFVFLLLLPVPYNRRKSPFEKNRVVLGKYDGIGVIQGLRGALFRLIVYEEGIEIRAFYHRYYIPYETIKKVIIEDRYFSKRLTIDTEIAGVPDYIVASDKKFAELAYIIEKKIRDKRPSVK